MGVWKKVTLNINSVITPTIVLIGTTCKVVRNGNLAMVHVHNDAVQVTFNVRTLLLSGLPLPAEGIVPTEIIDYGGISTLGNVEINQGNLYVVGSYTTSSTTIVVDSVVTYICQ